MSGVKKTDTKLGKSTGKGRDDNKGSDAMEDPQATHEWYLQDAVEAMFERAAEKGAEKALAHTAVKLRKLRNDLVVKEQELEQLRKQLNNEETRNLNLENQIQEKEQEIESLELKIEEQNILAEEMKEYHNRDAKDTKSKLETEANEKNNRIKELLDALKEAEKDNQRQTEAQEMRKKIQTLKSEVSRQNEEIMQLNDDLKQANKDTKEHADKLMEKDQLVADMGRKIARMRAYGGKLNKDTK